MSLRLLMALAVLLVCSCTNDPNKKTAIDDIDRRHTEDMQRMGGGGSGSGGGSIERAAPGQVGAAGRVPSKPPRHRPEVWSIVLMLFTRAMEATRGCGRLHPST